MRTIQIKQLYKIIIQTTTEKQHFIKMFKMLQIKRNIIKQTSKNYENFSDLVSKNFELSSK